MLACARCTPTHSSGWAAVPVGLGLAAMNLSREAETMAVGEVWDDDGDAEPGWDGEPVGEVDAEAEAEAEIEPEAEIELALGLDGGGDSGVLLGVLPAAGAVGEAEVDEAEGDGEGDVGPTVGVGVGVLAAGSTLHLVSVFALAEVLGLALVEA